MSLPQYAELCPRCERHFTDLPLHRVQPCAPVAITEIEPVSPPEFTFARWVEVFWSRVQRGGPDECWPWQGGTGVGGYGALGIPKPYRERIQVSKTAFARAHRVAWALTNGTLPARAVICHRCDNRPCCNPRHLYLGNHGENANDLAVSNQRRRLLGSTP